MSIEWVFATAKRIVTVFIRMMSIALQKKKTAYTIQRELKLNLAKYIS